MHDHPVALITGANRGLGLHTSRQLLALGWSVVTGVRQADLCSQTEAALADAVQTGRFLMAVALDLTQPSSVRAAVAAVQARAGRLDAAVANAGQFLDRAFGPLDVDPDLVRQTFDINTLGTLNLA
ncbi:MAG: SDR family NAD(P)-dependent oxidoreductase [Myxococcales bacterium]|nr:SDR family NAD(P)-dependent oxidoreductase [Myxococcales bacterium]